MYSKLLFDKGLNNKTAQFLRTEFKIGPSGKLIPRDPQGSQRIPWIFINHDMRKKFCGFWNHICTEHFNLIPTNCRFNCWKTVIKPRNVLELFECYDMFVALNLPSKIGADVRDYTFGAWAGFVYGDSLEEGKRYYSIVKNAIKPKKIPLILKRGCTEMERLIPSDKWEEITQKELELEKRLLDLFDFSELRFAQAQWLKSEIKERWIKRAIEIGDPTAREAAEKYSGNPDIWKKLVVQSITYHDK